MATILEADDGSIGEVIADVVAKYHEDLSHVAIGALRAFAKQSKTGSGHALQLGGYPCLATVRIVGYEQRVQGLPDALITVDAKAWEQMAPPVRVALIDHEVTHVELVDGKEDDCGRPKLKLRKHDHQFGWFDSVVRRHGMASCEARQLETFLHGPVKQLWLPFLDAPDGFEPSSDGDADVAIAKTIMRRMANSRLASAR